MALRQEFLVLESGNEVAVYAPSQFPSGTPIGRDARRLGVDGPSRARPPKISMSRLEFDRWCGQLEESDFTVTIGPFWTNPQVQDESEDVIRRRKSLPLKEAFDELLRQADGRVAQEDRPMEAVEPRHP
jgi:hypothetical protein